MEQSGPLQFGPYEVLEQIGAGGMGAVYRARDRRLERDVAIKVLHRHLEISGARERFLREARAVSSLNHTNICTIFDIGDQDGDPYLVMELLEGESLKERLQDGDLVSPSEWEAIATQAALALAAAHAKGIVHRDIKPANLFLLANPAGHVHLKVLDFGLAKIESDRLLYGDSGGLTRTGSTVGTVEYMSPEQARGEELDARSDLFSLGAVLYELATGDVPFRGATSAVVFAELLGANPIPPRSANASVSQGMDTIIRHLLEKRREKRTQSAAELLEELRSLRGTNQTTAPASRPKTLPPADRKPPVTRPSVEINEPAARAVRQRPTSAARASVVNRDVATDPRPSQPLRAAVPRDSRASREVARFSGVHDRASQPAGGISATVIGIIVAVLIVGAAAGFFLWKHGSTSAAPVTAFDGALQVSAFENSTGDAVLQETPAVALQILLGEMPTLKLLGYAPAPNTVEANAADLAAKTGASAYLTGAVSRDGERYHVHAELLKVGDNSKLDQEDVDAGSLVELPLALNKVAVGLRSHMGETPEQANADAVGLEAEATKSLPALADYARGAAMLRAGQPTAAIDPLTKALAEDATFPQARLALAEALREAGAEVERLSAVAPLKSLGTRGSLCLRDRVAYEVNDTAANADPAQHWATDCPNQVEAQIALAREQMAAGRDGEAEATANRALQLDPLGHTANEVATTAMLAQDHFESALKQQQHALATQVSSPGLTLLAAYLRGDTATEAQALTATEASPNWSDQWSYVSYLSNRGQLAEARKAGEAAAARFAGVQSVASSAGLMRARLAAIEAMAGHCDAAGLPVAAAGSDETAFFAALAKAWCHKPADSSVQMHDAALTAIARGAQAWGAGDATGALQTLQGSRLSSESPVAAMLRGEAHLAQKQQVVAIGDFKAIIARRGSAVLTGTLVYPAAHAGLATAYHTMGDEPNAKRAQADLQRIWATAAANEPLLHQAER